MDLSQIFFTGRLTKDPELRYTPAGVAVCSMTVACDRPFSNQAGDRETDFHDVIAWRAQAETCANYLRLGQEVTVIGRLQYRYYQNNDQRRVKVAEIIADNVKFGQPPKEKQSQGQGNRSKQNSGDPFHGQGTERTVNPDDDGLPF